MIELIVKLPEKTFELLKANWYGVVGAEHILSAVANGTPLPKGHGDLIDRNELEECKEIMNTITGESKYAVRMDDVRNMPTIIEADKKYEAKMITRGNCMICGKELTEGLFLCKECEEKGRKKGAEE